MDSLDDAAKAFIATTRDSLVERNTAIVWHPMVALRLTSLPDENGEVRDLPGYVKEDFFEGDDFCLVSISQLQIRPTVCPHKTDTLFFTIRTYAPRPG